MIYGFEMSEQISKQIYVSAIDIGTNSIHGIIASMDAKGAMNEISRDKESIRLGGSMINRIISDKGLAAATDTLKRFKKEADKHSAVIKAVATSAVREAENRDVFVKHIRVHTGIDVQVISGEQEGLLIYKGVNYAFPIFDFSTLIIDIGGGSTEIILAKKGEIIFMDSLKLGAIRTSNQFFNDFVTDEKSIQNCKNHIKQTMENSVKQIKETGFDFVVGTSGTIQALGRIVLFSQRNTSPKFLNGIIINSVDFYKLFSKIEIIHNPDQRALIPGIDLSRADLITAGELILQNFLNELSIPKMLISSYSLREGIIIDTFEKLSINNRNFKI